MLVTSGGRGFTTECLIEKNVTTPDCWLLVAVGLAPGYLHVKRSSECWSLVVV